MPSEHLRYEQDGHVVTLTLDQPDTRNALTDRDLCTAIVEAVSRIGSDPEVRCAIVTGAGKAFSSGGNLKHMRDRTGTFAGGAVDVRDGYRDGIQRVPRAVWGCEVPLIAAVNGPAYGAGCDLTLMCDLRIASTAATFAENFVAVGLIPGDGGAWLLPRQIGLARAAEMTFTAEPVDALTALDWGLVSRVVEPDELLPAAPRARRAHREETRRVSCAWPSACCARGSTPGSTRCSRPPPPSRGLCHRTEDHVEAVDALLERRTPTFTGPLNAATGRRAVVTWLGTSGDRHRRRPVSPSRPERDAVHRGAVHDPRHARHLGAGDGRAGRDDGGADRVVPAAVRAHARDTARPTDAGSGSERRQPDLRRAAARPRHPGRLAGAAGTTDRSPDSIHRGTSRTSGLTPPAPILAGQRQSLAMPCTTFVGERAKTSSGTKKSAISAVAPSCW